MQDWLMLFSFLYPFVMAWIWMTGGVYFYLRNERGQPAHDVPPALDRYPPVSILLPCYNEEGQVRETIEQLMRCTYPEFEVIAINDGSVDRTSVILDELLREYPRLRVIQHARNQGKASALNTAAILARHEILVCIDGDALLDRHALHWFVRHFNEGPRVGAVTGNPRIRTRSTLIGKLQVGEFSSIIGLIKRAQRVYGRLFTVSGVIAAFRRRALHDVGYWTPGMLTEDIDISWKLQLQHWDIRFEPQALAWILMPETLRGLWSQRLRWAMGGVQAILRHLPSSLTWRRRRMWGIFIEFLASLCWAYTIMGLVLLWLLGYFIALPPSMRVATLMPGWAGLSIGITCLLQFALSMRIERRYESGLGRYYFWMVWYPTAYWLIQVLTTIVALPRVLLQRRYRAFLQGTWQSPDRGVRAH